jgi:hypothetical protein
VLDSDRLQARARRQHELVRFECVSALRPCALRAALRTALRTALRALGGVFYVFTTEVFAVRVSSGIWWFALVLTRRATLP